jgi:peptide/nickel transport system ATP-binding protein
MRKENGSEVLRLENLIVDFHLHQGVLRAVNDVSFALNKGETMGLVGESGCGKSVTAMSIMGLNPSPPSVTRGKVFFDGENLLTKKPGEMRRIRGSKIGMIFQEPMTSLNPVFTAGQQIALGIQAHRPVSDREARVMAIDMLNQVGIPGAVKRVDSYPHEFSGGMRQRVMLALALVLKPALLIADEPTTALDVSVQAQILNLLEDLIADLDMAMIFISHDLNVVGDVCEKIGVMYMGQLVEMAATDEIFDNPQHPYTQGLLGCSPIFGRRVDRLKSVEGEIGDLLHPPSGCRFHPRCSKADPICREKSPALSRFTEDHQLACHLI